MEHTTNIAHITVYYKGKMKEPINTMDSSIASY